MSKSKRKLQANGAMHTGVGGGKTLSRVLVQCATAVARDAVTRRTVDGVEEIVISSMTLPDDIVMNGILYPADEIARSFQSLERTLAPVEHPTDAAGDFISATDPSAIHNFYAGAFNENVRAENGRIAIDKVVNVAQALKTEIGKRLLDRVAEIETNDQARPIHTSVGVFLDVEVLDAPIKQVNGPSAGQEFSAVARNMVFDHDAILLDSPGAAQPHQGVGMAVNAEGNKLEVQNALVTIDTDTSAEMSHNEVREALNLAITQPPFSGDWVADVFDDTVIYWVDDLLFSAPYILDGQTAKITGLPLPVERNTSYTPRTNAMRLTLNYLKKQGVTVNGALSERLTTLIDRKAADDDERSQIIDDMASAAGIERGTVLLILAGDIERPPENRLRGFAEVLGVSLKSLQDLIPTTNRNKGDAMRESILAAMAAAGITVNTDISDADLLAQYTTLQANQNSDSPGAGTGEGTGTGTAATDAVTANALELVLSKLDSLEQKVNQKDTDELDRLAEIIGNSDKFPGMTVEVAKAAGLTACKAMAANCATSHGLPLHVNDGTGTGDSHTYAMPA